MNIFLVKYIIYTLTVKHEQTEILAQKKKKKRKEKRNLFDNDTEFLSLKIFTFVADLCFISVSSVKTQWHVNLWHGRRRHWRNSRRLQKLFFNDSERGINNKESPGAWPLTVWCKKPSLLKERNLQNANDIEWINTRCIQTIRNLLVPGPSLLVWWTAGEIVFEIK